VQIAAVTATPNSGTSSQARIDIGSTLINRDQRLRHMDLAGEHTFGPLDVEWGGLWSRTRYRTLGAEGALTNRIGFIPMVGPNGGPITTVRNTVPISGPNGETGVGWILDRTKSDLYPQFLPNGGLDWTNPNNYRPSENGLSTSSGNLDVDLVKEARAHLRYSSRSTRLPPSSRAATRCATTTSSSTASTAAGATSAPPRSSPTLRS